VSAVFVASLLVWVGRGGLASEDAVRLEPIDVPGVAVLARNDSPRWRLINLWATWCAPCLTELPLLVAADGRYRELEVVTISTDGLELRGEALEFLTRIDATTRNLIVGFVDTRELAEALDPDWRGPLPYTVLVAPGGGVAHRKLGAFGADELRELIESHLGDPTS
jgi:thiol-disulfide isomerase/thioredoxin